MQHSKYSPLSSEAVGLWNIPWRHGVRIVGQTAYAAVSVPTNRILKAIIAPKQFAPHDECRRTKDTKRL